MDVFDLILGDLVKCFFMCKFLKLVIFMNEKESVVMIVYLRELIEKVGFNFKYYIVINLSYDLFYDFYCLNKDCYCI